MIGDSASCHQPAIVAHREPHPCVCVCCRPARLSCVSSRSRPWTSLPHLGAALLLRSARASRAASPPRSCARAASRASSAPSAARRATGLGTRPAATPSSRRAQQQRMQVVVMVVVRRMSQQAQRRAPRPALATSSRWRQSHLVMWLCASSRQQHQCRRPPTRTPRPPSPLRRAWARARSALRLHTSGAGDANRGSTVGHPASCPIGLQGTRPHARPSLTRLRHQLTCRHLARLRQPLHRACRCARAATRSSPLVARTRRAAKGAALSIVQVAAACLMHRRTWRRACRRQTRVRA